MIFKSNIFSIIIIEIISSTNMCGRRVDAQLHTWTVPATSELRAGRIVMRSTPGGAQPFTGQIQPMSSSLKPCHRHGHMVIGSIG